MAVNRRGRILINKPFQLRFTLYVCSWLVVLSIIYPMILSTLFEYMITMLSLDPNAPQVANLFRIRDEFLWLVLGMQGMMVGIILLISLFMSHRIAGPLFKLGRYFRDARDGNLSQKLTFRKTDYFQELVPDYNAMMARISERMALHQLAESDVLSIIEKVFDQSPPEVQKQLTEALIILKNSNNI